MEIGAHRVRRKLVGLKNPVHGCRQVIQCVQQRSVQVEYDRFEIALGFSVQRDFFKKLGGLSDSLSYNHPFILEALQ